MRLPRSIVFLAALGALAAGCQRRGAVDHATVAIATLMRHPALDEVRAGIIEGLKGAGLVEGRNLAVIDRNANGQMSALASIAEDLARIGADVTVPVTTPMAQAVVRAVHTPIVFAAVTDPISAGVVSSLATPPPTITGTSDAFPYGSQLHLIRELTPAVQRLGVLYNPGDAAARYGIDQIRKLASSEALAVTEIPVNSTTEVYPAALSAVTRVDAILITSDNTTIAGIAGILRAALPRRIPVYAGESGSVARGALATVSVGYRQLGIETGRLVARMLRGERNIPVVVASGTDIVLNRETARLLGLTIPQAILGRAATVLDSITGR